MLGWLFGDRDLISDKTSRSIMWGFVGGAVILGILWWRRKN